MLSDKERKEISRALANETNSKVKALTYACQVLYLRQLYVSDARPRQVEPDDIERDPTIVRVPKRHHWAGINSTHNLRRCDLALYCTECYST